MRKSESKMDLTVLPFLFLFCLNYATGNLSFISIWFLFLKISDDLHHASKKTHKEGKMPEILRNQQRN